MAKEIFYVYFNKFNTIREYYMGILSFINPSIIFQRDVHSIVKDIQIVLSSQPNEIKKLFII